MLLYITYNICCSYFQIHEEINHLKSVQQKNSFPLFFIDNCIQNFFNKLLIKRAQNSTTTQKKEIIIPLEYSGKNILKQHPNIFRSCHNDIKINTVFKTLNRLCNAFRFKDQLPKCIGSKVLYKHKCDICSHVYIGKSKRH